MARTKPPPQPAENSLSVAPRAARPQPASKPGISLVSGVDTAKIKDIRGKLRPAASGISFSPQTDENDNNKTSLNDTAAMGKMSVLDKAQQFEKDKPPLAAKPPPIWRRPRPERAVG